MTAVVSFGQAAAGCGVQSEHEAHACCLGSGGLLQTVSSDRYHVPWDGLVLVVGVASYKATTFAMQ